MAHPIEGVHHERMGVLAVMDVAGAVKDIEELSGLRHVQELSTTVHLHEEYVR